MIGPPDEPLAWPPLPPLPPPLVPPLPPLVPPLVPPLEQVETVMLTGVPWRTRTPADGFCVSTSPGETQSSRCETLPTTRWAPVMALVASPFGSSLTPRRGGTVALPFDSTRSTLVPLASRLCEMTVSMGSSLG